MSIDTALRMPLSVVESDQVVLKCMQQSVSVVGRVLDARVAFIIRMMPPQLLSLLLRAISLHSLFSLPIPSFRSYNCTACTTA